MKMMRSMFLGRMVKFYGDRKMKGCSTNYGFYREGLLFFLYP